jgi:flagellar hook assembly protein FlgD
LESQRAVSFASIRLNFKGIAETSEPYTVALKRNGATVKSWAGLTGEQNLSWDGMQNGQALADGSYRIVATTEKQRDRVRDAQMVVLDTVGPVFTNSRIQKKNGGYRIQSAMSDKPAGIQPGTLGLVFQDAQGQAAGITGQLETENGVSPFVYNLQASAEQFNQLKAGDIQAKASVQDKAGNTANFSLNFEDEISLSSFTQEPDGTLLLKGKILKNTGTITTLTPDFDGGLEILTPPVINRTGNQFEIRISDYKFAESLVEEPQLGDVISEKVTLLGHVNGCEANGECLSSNTKELKTPECTSMEAPDENSDLFSNCKASESFSIQAAPSAPGAAITTRHYIHGGGQNNRPLTLGFSMRNTSKQSQIVGYWITDASGKWVKTLKRTVYPPTGNRFGPVIPAPWDGTNAAGQVVGEGTYYTVIRAPGKTERATKIVVGCQGYYNKYPKILDNDDRFHIYRRHNPNYNSEGFKQLLRNYVTAGRTAQALQALTNKFDSRHQDAYRWPNSRDKGKADLFPDNWLNDDIDFHLTSVANFKSPNDTCRKQSDGRFVLEGSRDNNVPLRVILTPSDRNLIITGFPPRYQDPVIYYTQNKILDRLIGRH